MKPHWNEEEFAENVLGGVTKSSQPHADECADCRGELEHFNSLVREFRDATYTSAERPQLFWSTQQTAIRARVAARSKPHGLRFAIAGAVALAALAAAMLIPATAPQPQINTASTAPIHVDQDELLMRQIDDSLLSTVAEPLEPANLIASDMGKAIQQAQSNSKQP